MKKVTLLFVVFCVLSVAMFGCWVSPEPENTPDGQTTPEPSPNASLSIELSRTSGVAPLAVHFFAQAVAFSQSDNAFLDYEFIWDFGDPSSGNWENDGKSRNRAKGAVAAHLYESAGTYTIGLSMKDNTGRNLTATKVVTVEDPNLVFSGEKTICVSDSAHNDFSDAPSGALHISTNDLSTVTPYAQAGTRILFHRGSAWTCTGLTWPNNSGPVSIGAFGSGTQDEFGLYTNAPRFQVNAGYFMPIDRKQDWRVSDLEISDPSKTFGSFSGSMEIQQFVFQRLRMTGFDVTLGWSHWNTDALMPLDQMMIWGCDISGSHMITLYCGGERLALLGNRVKDADTSHTVRVWQSYKGVISHNRISGASLSDNDGRHALKFHGPGLSTLENPPVNEYGQPLPDTNLLENRTSLSVISDNVFGSSGPWPVNIAPQDGLTDALLENIVFERNRIATQFGSQNRSVTVALRILARNVVVRNNILDGTGSGSSYTGIHVYKDGDRAPDPQGIRIYNNSIYRSGGTGYVENRGIIISPQAQGTSIKNNLICFPSASDERYLIVDQGVGTEKAANLLETVSIFTDPTNVNPLLRDFSLLPASSAINSGLILPVFEDFLGLPRNDGSFDIGAMEYR